eukprot:scaffold633218_cov17-Prasinocladus_malaysianus.AAC.1
MSLKRLCTKPELHAFSATAWQASLKYTNFVLLGMKASDTYGLCLSHESNDGYLSLLPASLPLPGTDY